MIPISRSFSEQQEFFKKNNIETNSPGFYDHPAFLKLEMVTPEILDNYASYVEQQPYDESYLSEAGKKIKIIAEILYHELEIDGRNGACVDMAMTLSRILEEEGIWNYAVKGSLTIKFPRNLGIRDKYFYSIDHGRFTAGHAWIVAPPFKIIDLTLKHQSFIGNGSQFIPKFVLNQQIIKEEFEVQDIMEPDIVNKLKTMYGEDFFLTRKKDFGHIKTIVDFFQPGSVTVNGIKLKYTPVGIGAPDARLTDLGCLVLNGKLAAQLYYEFIKPTIVRETTRL